MIFFDFHSSVGRNIVQLAYLAFYHVGGHQILEVGKGDARRGCKVLGNHVFQHAAVELSTLRIGCSLLKIGHTDKQTALAHLELEYQSELVVALDIVDNLNYRAIVVACIVENERMAGFDDGVPLPVGVHLGGEAAEKWMLGVAKDAESARRDGLLVVLGDGLEHALVPVVSLEKAAHAELR